MQYAVAVGSKKILFECPNEATLGRAKWLLEKEPGTISWINSFSPNSTFWDIGANIGSYALYASIVRNCRVLAFEPAAMNYLGLNENIILNGMDDRVQAYCLAIDCTDRLDVMHMRDSIVGSALHTFGVATDYKGESFIPAWLQGSLAVSIDSLVETFGAPIPNHIKIDVDGLEVAVVEGGARTFADPRLQSALIEVDLNDRHEVAAVAEVLEAGGLSRDNTVPGNAVRSHRDAEIYNLIYRRNG